MTSPFQHGILRGDWSDYLLLSDVAGEVSSLLVGLAKRHSWRLPVHREKLALISEVQSAAFQLYKIAVRFALSANETKDREMIEQVMALPFSSLELMNKLERLEARYPARELNMALHGLAALIVDLGASRMPPDARPLPVIKAPLAN